MIWSQTNYIAQQGQKKKGKKNHEQDTDDWIKRHCITSQNSVVRSQHLVSAGLQLLCLCYIEFCLGERKCLRIDGFRLVFEIAEFVFQRVTILAR